jgi:parallel beta-helix repeat protein
MRAFITCCATAVVVTACNVTSDVTSPLSGASEEPLVSRVLVTDLSCGDVITTDVHLEEDLTCAGDALTIGADGIRINLNGHVISGNATGVGITLRQRSDVVIHGGTVRNFVTGIFVSQSTGVTVKDNRFTLNREAVFLIGSSGNVVKANRAWANTQRGIMLRPTTGGIVSTDNQVVGNTLTDNPSGILVFGQSGNTLKGNTISGSTVGGFDLTGGGGSGNDIRGNVVTGSAVGIKFGTGWTGNFIIDNMFATNTCGLAGPGASNTYKDNVFTSNVTNICP